MKPEEIIAFLTPGNDAIQLGFGALFLVLILATLIGVWRGATPRSWEKKWNGSQNGNSADDLDVEHGSVNEISAAVASTGEKLADIMPGILLILGLLGTFLGLGIALNKASTILIEANSGGGMDNAMANLMGMMEGLGTKFKTSTWGIIAFLLLKAWSAKNGYEERRLRWCVGKMKAAFEHSRHMQLQERQQTQQALIEALGKIDQTLIQQGQASDQQFEVQQKLSKHAGVTLIATHKAMQEMQQVLAAELRTLNGCSGQTRDALQESLGVLQQHSLTLKDTHTAVEGLQNALKPEMTELNTIGKQSLTRLQEMSSILEQHTTTLAGTHIAIQEMQHALLAPIETLNTTAEQSLAALGETAGALRSSAEIQEQQLVVSQAAQQSLKQLETDISNLGTISDAAAQMATAASAVGESATELRSVVSGLKEGIGEVLGSLKHDLGGTIDQMGDSFTTNMASMSATMAEATGGISKAVQDLSINVGATMKQVQASNEESMKIQKDAHGEFLLTSDTLNRNVEGMTTLVNDLREQILSGLRAVSESGLRMKSLDAQFKDVTEKATASATAMEHLVGELKRLQQASPLQPAVDAVAGRVEMIGKSMLKLDSHLQTLAKATADERQLQAIAQLQHPLERIVVGLDSLHGSLGQRSLHVEEA